MEPVRLHPPPAPPVPSAPTLPTASQTTPLGAAFAQILGSGWLGPERRRTFRSFAPSRTHTFAFGMRDRPVPRRPYRRDQATAVRTLRIAFPRSAEKKQGIHRKSALGSRESATGRKSGSPPGRTGSRWHRSPRPASGAHRVLAVVHLPQRSSCLPQRQQSTLVPIIIKDELFSGV